MRDNKFTPPHTKRKWICEERKLTPQTKDGCCPAITATYAFVSYANIMTTAHFPRAAVVEIGRYTDE